MQTRPRNVSLLNLGKMTLASPPLPSSWEKVGGGRWLFITSGGAPPGGPMLIDVSPPPDPIELAPGDILALISDGIYEYQNAEGKQFDNDRVGEVFRKGHCQPMADLIVSLRSAVSHFAGDAPQMDDMTVVLVKRLP